MNQPINWVEILRQQCEQTSQVAVSKKLGYSPAVINQVLKGTYKGDLKGVETAVRGVYMGDTVICPVLGVLATNRCQQIQKRPFANTNPTRIALYRSCRMGCPHSQLPITEVIHD